jgi:hypothetical protein
MAKLAVIVAILTFSDTIPYPNKSVPLLPAAMPSEIQRLCTGLRDSADAC